MAYRSRSRAVVLAAMVVVILLGSVAPIGDLTPRSTGSSAASGTFASAAVVPLSASSLRAGTDVEVAPAYSLGPGVVEVGPMPAESPLTVDVGLALPDPSALAGLVSALYAPGSPEYRGFLSPSELASRFGPSLSTVSAAQAYFERFGLSVRPSPDRLLLTGAGPSARVGAAFGTTFEEYRNADGRTFVSHPTAAVLPAVVPWSGAYGLGNVTPLLPAVSPVAPLGTEIASAANCSGSVTTLVPCQIWHAYNMTSLISGGTNGSGVHLAVVDAYSSGEPQILLVDDLELFASESGIAVGSVNYVYPDPAPGDLNSSTNPGWNLEDALDLEWARAAAPGATIDMTFSPDAGPGLYAAVDWLVAHQAANVISMSWGEPDVGIYNAFSGPCYSACNASTDGSYGLLSPVLAFAAAEVSAETMVTGVEMTSAHGHAITRTTSARYSQSAKGAAKSRGGAMARSTARAMAAGV
jgi:kumamolisin